MNNDEVPILFEDTHHQQWIVSHHARLVALEQILENHISITKKIADDTAAMRQFMNDGAAAFRFFDRVWPAIRLAAKTILIILGSLLLGYALTHEGHFPPWFVRAWEVVK